MVKNLAVNAGRRHVFDLWLGKMPWRRAWQPTPVFLAWRIPRTEEPGGLQSMGLQRVRSDLATEAWLPDRKYLADFSACEEKQKEGRNTGLSVFPGCCLQQAAWGMGVSRQACFGSVSGVVSQPLQ